MSDFRQQIRSHYDRRPLAPDKLADILAQGEKAAADDETQEGSVVELKRSRPPQRWGRRMLAMAATLAIAAVGTGWWMQHRDAGKVSYALLAPRVVQFFAHEPDLRPAPQEKAKLHEMLVAHGAPKDFRIPAALMPLESEACSVVDVSGRNAYLSCYWRVAKAAAPETPRGPQDLIHLLVVNSGDFYGEPKAGQPATTQELEGWSFATWTKDDVVYMLAAAAPMDKVMPYLSQVEQDEGIRFRPGGDEKEARAILSAITQLR